MSTVTHSTNPPGQDEIEYPASDGQPMAETGIHVQAIIQLFEGFQDYLPATSFIAADMFWYWEEGHPKSRVAPDVMVVKGVGRAHRRSFFTWREGGAVPCIVFEMASEHTWREDLREKRRLYERLGVRE
jgi:Uma2 family endonuclease